MVMSNKRRHERGHSLSLRPRKTIKAGEDDITIDDNAGMPTLMDVEEGTSEGHVQHPETIWQRLQMVSSSNPVIVPPLQFLGRDVCPLTTFNVSGITAWPSSLGVIRKQFRYNLTPQDAPLLPMQVLNLTAWRCMKSSPDGGSASPPVRAPYLHLGFSTWLHIDIFVFLPNLALTHCIEQNPGRLQHNVLEVWTDRVFLPAMYDRDSRAPSSWARSAQHSTSPLWYDLSIAEFPTYQIFDGKVLDSIWNKIVAQSVDYAEFRDPYLVMHTNTHAAGSFTGTNPETVFSDFEQAWMQEIDSRHVELGEDSLKISLSCDVAV